MRWLIVTSLAFLVACGAADSEGSGTDVDLVVGDGDGAFADGDVMSGSDADGDAPDSDADRGDADAGDADAGDGDASFVPTPTGCIDDVEAGDHVYRCDGLTYDVRVPASCLAGGCGLIVDIHGLTCNAAIEEANTDLRALAPPYGYIVVQPNAPGAVPGTSWIPYADNAELVWGFMALARDVFGLDADRLHVTGFSQGSRMTYALLCAHGDAIASAAPAAEGGDCFNAVDGAPARELDLLFMFGREDGLVSYEQRGVGMRDDIIDTWDLGAGSVVASGTGFTRTRYTNPGGTVLEFLSHDYSASSLVIRGHCYPGSDDAGDEPGQVFSFACAESGTFHWGAEVLAFFRAHPRR